MRIAFVTYAPVFASASGPTSNMASARYRAITPARALTRAGHEVSVVATPQAGWTPAQIEAIECDVAVISKSFHESNEALAKRLRTRGARVVMDICDNHFETEHREHFLRMIGLADQLVAGSARMGEIITAKTGRSATVVSDPVEGPRGESRFSPAPGGVTIAWFGNVPSLNGLFARFPEAYELSQRVPLALTVVTTPCAEAGGFVGEINKRGGSRMRAHLVPWSLDATWAALAQADVVWIPAQETERASVKTPNRLLEGIWAGRWVVADAIPSYDAYRDNCAIGKGLVNGVMEAMENPEGASARIREGQEAIARDHTAQAIGARWIVALRPV